MVPAVHLQQLDEVLDEEGNVMLIARDVNGHNTAYINGRSFDVQIDRQARPAALQRAHALSVMPVSLHTRVAVACVSCRSLRLASP